MNSYLLLKLTIGIEQVFPLFRKMKRKDPNPDLENRHCERSEAISPSKLRLPRTLRVLATTDRSMLCKVHIGIWEKIFVDNASVD